MIVKLSYLFAAGRPLFSLSLHLFQQHGFIQQFRLDIVRLMYLFSKSADCAVMSLQSSLSVCHIYYVYQCFLILLKLCGKRESENKPSHTPQGIFMPVTLPLTTLPISGHGNQLRICWLACIKDTDKILQNSPLNTIKNCRSLKSCCELKKTVSLD